jgi:hypothetical protein
MVCLVCYTSYSQKTVQQQLAEIWPSFGGKRDAAGAASSLFKFRACLFISFTLIFDRLLILSLPVRILQSVTESTNGFNF